MDGIAERFAGWRLVVLTFLFEGAMVVEMVASWGSGEESIRTIIRSTARVSFALFTLAFVASSARRLFPNAATRWLLRNRRYLGVSFAVSHAYHALALGMLADFDPATFAAQNDAVTIAFGGFAYVLIAAMTATSFDASARWLGPAHWKRLHTFGVYYLWFVFTITTLPAVFVDPAYLPYPLVAFGVLALRIAAALRRRRARPPAGDAGDSGVRWRA